MHIETVLQQDGQCTYNVTFSSVCATVIPVVKQ